MKQRHVNLSHIIVHCADTPPSMDIGAAEIREWHVEKGWDDIGYHFVIRRNGETEIGRPFDMQGAHVSGWNACSIGICLIGGRHGAVDYTRFQWDALKSLVFRLKLKFPKVSVMGHCDFGAGKTCPNFSVMDWWGEAQWREDENWIVDMGPEAA
jgi:hypothetical protein